jgi:hypothetical protein
MEYGEYKILSKYIGGDDIDEKDRLILEEFGNIGFVRFGYSIERKCETVKLTEKGKSWVNREQIYRSPIRRFFHNWYALLVKG